MSRATSPVRANVSTMLSASKPAHHDHIFDTGTAEGLNDPREKRIAIFQRQIGFGAPHPRRGAGGKHDGGSHVSTRFYHSVTRPWRRVKVR